MRRRIFLLLLVVIPLLVGTVVKRVDGLDALVATLCPSANCWGAAAALTATGALDVGVVGCQNIDATGVCAEDFNDYVADLDTVVSGTTPCAKEGDRHLETDVVPPIECECTDEPANLWRCWEAQDTFCETALFAGLMAVDDARPFVLRRPAVLTWFQGNAYGVDPAGFIVVIDECNTSGASCVESGGTVTLETPLTPVNDVTFTDANIEAANKYLQFRVDVLGTPPTLASFTLCGVHN